MVIFLDTGNIDEIRKYHEMGLIGGVTTNPTILLKNGVKKEELEERMKEIAELIDPCPLSVEVTATEPEEMIEEARMYKKWADNINVKIPFHGPNGGTEYLKVIHDLSSEVKINATAMMSSQQGFLAAIAGAQYVSLFAGRIADMGYDPKLELAKLSKLIEHNSLNATIIAASTREVSNIIDWHEAGADIVTVTPDLLEKMVYNARTAETVQMFIDDAKKL